MKWLIFSVCLFQFIQPLNLCAQGKDGQAFTIIPLGVKGGLDESNLSAYLVAANNSTDFICLDAGTIRYGIEQAIRQKSLTGDPGVFIRQQIKGYFISHAHLDHLSGLVMNSPNDSNKYIYAVPEVISILKTHYFTWKSWANFSNEGEAPALKKYQYVPLRPLVDIPVHGTKLSVTAFPLCHSNPYESTAFLVNNAGNQLLYLGDTGPDSIEHCNRLQDLWKAVAGQIRSHQLKGIFIELSFPDEQPDQQLFGHLTPRWLMQELQTLATLVGVSNLQQVKIFITHIKPGGQAEERIRQQLKKRNTLGLQFYFPRQGERIQL